MNVAVVEPASVLRESPQPGHCTPAPAGYENDWIDPEGDDWLSWIYRELTQESPLAAASSAPEVEHWFG